MREEQAEILSHISAKNGKSLKLNPSAYFRERRSERSGGKDCEIHSCTSKVRPDYG
jgi:hypothetical protein